VACHSHQCSGLMSHSCLNGTTLLMAEAFHALWFLPCSLSMKLSQTASISSPQVQSGPSSAPSPHFSLLTAYPHKSNHIHFKTLLEDQLKMIFMKLKKQFGWVKIIRNIEDSLGLKLGLDYVGNYSWPRMRLDGLEVAGSLSRGILAVVGQYSETNFEYPNATLSLTSTFFVESSS
jgi:hypothetical protein